MKSARNIFITGGMGGIGKSCVEKFVDQGDQVVFTYAEEKSNQIAAEEYAASLGKSATAIAIDMSDPTSIRSALTKSQSIMGSIDTLVNAAAVGSATVNTYAVDKDSQDSKMLEINAYGALKISEIFIEINKETTLVKKLINFSSVGGGLQAFPHFRLSDGMSKAAVSFLTKQLAAEHVYTNIDVFAIAPGATNTGMFQASTLNSMSADEKRDFIAKLPKQRLIEPDEIADLVIFLAAESSTYMHGAIIDASMGLGSRPGLISEM
jgi:NAD(P)-dependent dehydrogenase (short-subunit alcohol dehydrogenase family)